jgi:ribosomal protein S1
MDSEYQSDEMLEFTGTVKAISKDAMLMMIDGITGWVPFSRIDWKQEPEVGKEIDVEIPYWLATKKGFL